MSVHRIASRQQRWPVSSRYSPHADGLWARAGAASTWHKHGLRHSVAVRFRDCGRSTRYNRNGPVSDNGTVTYRGRLSMSEITAKAREFSPPPGSGGDHVARTNRHTEDVWPGEHGRGVRDLVVRTVCTLLGRARELLRRTGRLSRRRPRLRRRPRRVHADCGDSGATGSQSVDPSLTFSSGSSALARLSSARTSGCPPRRHRHPCADDARGVHSGRRPQILRPL